MAYHTDPDFDLGPDCRLYLCTHGRGSDNIFGVMKNRIYMISFGIGAALAAGTMFRILSPFTPYMGTIPGIMAFVVIIIGGLGSIPGAIIAGLLLGLVQNFTIFYFGRRRRKLANVL
jgi:branched-subunit amino acid ABC-type transport system permease component